MDLELTMVKEESSENEDKLVQKFDEMLKKEQLKRARYEAIWRHCLFFLSGDQWLQRDKTTKRIVRETPSRRPRHRVRLVMNKIRGAVDTRVSKMTQNEPRFKATAASQDIDDLHSARLGEALLTYLYRVCECPKKLTEVVLWSLVGQGYWEILWNDSIGDDIEYFEDPETGVHYPADSYEADVLAKNGYESSTVKSGEIEVQVLSPFEVYTFPAKDPHNAKSAIKVKGYSRDDAKRRWPNAKLTPNGEDSLNLQQETDAHEKKDTVIVKEVFITESEKYPNGLYMVYSGEEIIHRGDYPYKSKKLPFVKFDGLHHPSNEYDDSFIWNLIPLQRELNMIISQITEYKNLTMYPQIWAARGSLDRKKITTEPGQVIEYNIQPLAKESGLPQERQSPPLPNYVYTMVENIESMFRDISGEADLTDSAPARLDSGYGLEVLDEVQNAKIRPYINSMERSLSHAGTFMLEIAQQFYSDERILEIRGAAGITELKSFRASDLSGIKDIYVEPGSMAPYSPAAKANTLQQMLEMGAIDHHQYLSLMENAGLEELNAEWQADTRVSAREVETMINTRQEIPDPAPWDNHEAHVNQMSKYAKTEEYEMLDDALRDFFMAHYEKHSEILSEQHQSQLMEDKLRLALNIQQRDEVDPELLSGMARGAGIDLDPEAVVLNEEAKRESEHENRIAQLDKKAEIKSSQIDQQADAQQETDAVNAELQRQLEETKALLEEQIDIRKDIREIVKEAIEEKEDLKVVPLDTSSADQGEIPEEFEEGVPEEDPASDPYSIEAMLAEAEEEVEMDAAGIPTEDPEEPVEFEGEIPGEIEDQLVNETVDQALGLKGDDVAEMEELLLEEAQAEAGEGVTPQDLDPQSINPENLEG